MHIEDHDKWLEYHLTFERKAIEYLGTIVIMTF